MPAYAPPQSLGAILGHVIRPSTPSRRGGYSVDYVCLAGRCVLYTCVTTNMRSCVEQEARNEGMTRTRVPFSLPRDSSQAILIDVINCIPEGI